MGMTLVMLVGLARDYEAHQSAEIGGVLLGWAAGCGFRMTTSSLSFKWSLLNEWGPDIDAEPVDRTTVIIQAHMLNLGCLVSRAP